MFYQQVKIFFLKIDIERAEPQALIGMNTLFLSHRVENAVFEARSPSEIEVLFELGYSCGAIDDFRHRCSYQPSVTRERVHTDRSTAHHDQLSATPQFGKHSLRPQCFFHNMAQAEHFYKTKSPYVKRGYHSVHCFLKKELPSVDAIVQQEAEKYTDKLLEYDGNLFRVVSRNGKPFLEEQPALAASLPSPPVVNISFRTMFLIESDLK